MKRQIGALCKSPRRGPNLYFATINENVCEDRRNNPRQSAQDVVGMPWKWHDGEEGLGGGRVRVVRRPHSEIVIAAHETRYFGASLRV